MKTWDELQKLAPGGSDENASYRMVVTYWDMVASFITSGMLHQELFFQSGREMLLVWERMRDVLPEIRQQYKDPHLWSHLETVGNQFAAYFQERSRGRLRGVLEEDQWIGTVYSYQLSVQGRIGTLN